MLKIVPIKAGEERHQICLLFEEYAASLDFDLSFQNFEEELANLPGDYTPPEGRLLLAWWDDQIAGCVALRKINPEGCEMKRLYVRPQFRRLEIGKTLAGEIIKEAKKIGYTWMRLDTVPSMKEARALYESLGFKKIPPYRHNPIAGAVFLELRLSTSARLPDS
jgi:ribosomal protein S18 acetylase RimI-like enzyme